MSERRLRVQIRDSIDVFAARRAAGDAARELGFPKTATVEIAIVVSELSTNILKYGLRGHIDLGRVEDDHRGVGIEIVAHDAGPPIADLANALIDGHGGGGPIDPAHLLRRRGIGAGLGAVVRMTDELEYHVVEGGKWFRAVRYLHRPKRSGPLPCDPPVGGGFHS